MLICDRCLYVAKDDNEIAEGVCLKCWPNWVRDWLDKEGIV